MTAPVLYAICCAAPPALHASKLVQKARTRSWDVCLIATPTAARWLQNDLPVLESISGHPVRSQYKLPGEPDVLPPPDALLVAPATFNTLNKWALGISDTLALGLITEAVGKRLPIVALPYLNAAQAAHPAFPRNVALLREAGVTVLLSDDGHVPHQPQQGDVNAFPWDVALDTVSDKLQSHGQLP
ncbi:Flavoprotein [Sinosporangium album]|uniref:Flavoprotein n=1 Tax=Sinosporangium album TaxID=504805 RepID=A0A1G8K4N4_9ACTN|nr:flavoprotein [Sinosporangium album]SDI38382.1 Flavoprotein [Sinosporangium album]